MKSENDDVIQHYSHPHPLALVVHSSSLTKAYCEACRKACDNFAYGCSTCKIFLHKSCLEMPRKIQHFFHSCPLFLEPRASYRCDVCPEYTCSLFAYKCSLCNFKMGSRCAFMSGTIKSDAHQEMIQYVRQDSIEHFRYGHPLVLLALNEGDKVYCNACNDVCSDIAYGCSICNFILHKSCAVLPREIHHPFHPQHPLTITCKSTTWKCEGCGKTIKDLFGYCCKKCGFHLDLDCTRLIPTINFDGHKHVLTLFSLPDVSGGVCELCGYTVYGILLRCVMCKYNAHLRCYPSLPETIKHECHIHQLTLFGTRPQEDKADASYKYWCHACEEERKDGFDAIYYCSKCRFAAHLKCVISEILPFLTAKEQTVMGSAIGGLSPEKGKDVCGDASALANLDRDIAETRAEVDSLSAEKAKLEIQFTRLQADIKDISEKIEQRKKRLGELEAERGWHVVMFTASDKKE